MTTQELMKPASGGEHTGMSRIAIVLQRVKNGEDFELNDGTKVKIDAKKTSPVLDALRTGDQETIDKVLKNGTTQYKPVIFTTSGQALPITAFKKAQYFGGGMAGRGGGAEKTALRESATAFTLAMRGELGRDLDEDDFETDHLSKFSSLPTVQVTSSTMEIFRFLQESVERTSAMLTANAFYESFPVPKSYVWHRGSGWVKQMETTFNRVNKEEGRFFININKWNPSDVWCVKPGIQAPSGKDMDSFDKLNVWVNKNFSEGNVYGVSLKLVVKHANVTTVNDSHTGPVHLAHIIKRLIVSKRNQLFGSKDSHIVFESAALDVGQFLPEDEVQYRSFGGDDPIQGQITGTRAAHGKVGHGPTNKFLERLGMPTLTPRNEIYAMIDKGAKDNVGKYERVVERIIDMAATVDPAFKKGKEDVQKNAKEMDNNMMISKFQAVELMMILHDATEAQRKKFINNIVGYAGSSTQLSSTFVKVYEG